MTKLLKNLCKTKNEDIFLMGKSYKVKPKGTVVNYKNVSL